MCKGVFWWRLWKFEMLVATHHCEYHRFFGKSEDLIVAQIRFFFFLFYFIFLLFLLGLNHCYHSLYMWLTSFLIAVHFKKIVPSKLLRQDVESRRKDKCSCSNNQVLYLISFYSWISFWKTPTRTYLEKRCYRGRFSSTIDQLTLDGIAANRHEANQHHFWMMAAGKVHSTENQHLLGGQKSLELGYWAIGQLPCNLS